MTLRVLSLGAGVQSTAMALMTARGELPLPDCAIFADTQAEPAAVYEHLDKLEQALPYPLYRVTAGNLRADTLKRSNTTGGRFAAVPWYTLSAKGVAGMGRRQCTKEYKLRPIQRRVVEIMGGLRLKASCEMWIGISTDEAARMKPSRVQYITNRYPLIDLRMSRQDCLKWLSAKGWGAPRSACIFCPYRSDEEWLTLTPLELQSVIEVDEAIRNQPRFHSQQFVHRSRKPLALVDFVRGSKDQLNLFDDECEGMCGV